MISASFDVRGASLDALIENGQAIAKGLVGGRGYTYDMDVSPAVMAHGKQDPVSWVAEFRLTIKDPL